MSMLDFIKSGGDTDYLFLPAGAWDTNKQVATSLESRLQEQYQAGLVDYDQFQRTTQEISGTTTFDALFAEPGNSPTKTFVEAIGDGVKKLPDTVNSFLGGAVNGIFRSIPWQIYLLLLIGIALYALFALGWIRRLAYVSK
jgi:hypothetical protein